MDSPESRREIEALVNPQSVAVIGVSRDPRKFGRVTIDNLLDSEVPRRLFAIGSPELTLPEAEVLTSVEELPPVDVAIIASPAGRVVETIRTAAKSGTTRFIVYASDFAEASETGRQRDQALRELVLDSDLMLIGPNTLGVVSFTHQFAGTFTPCRDMTESDGNIAVVSQSGGLGWLLSHARHEGVGISHMLGAGNSSGMDAVNLAHGLLDDPHTHAVALAIEGVRDGRSIARLGEAALRAGKPIVAWKAGTSDLGAERAMSHTGTLTGDSKLYSAALAEAGIIEVAAFEDLMETAALAAACRDRPAETFAPIVASTSGGAIVMAADAAVEAGVRLDPPSPRSAEALANVLPGFMKPSNPLDITSFIQSEESALESIVTELAEGDRWPLVFPWSTSHSPANRERIRGLAALVDKLELPTAVVLLSRWTTTSDVPDVRSSASAAPFGTMARAFRAVAGIGLWVRKRHETLLVNTTLDYKIAETSTGRHFGEAGEGHDIRDWWRLPRPAAVTVANRRSAAEALGKMRPPAVLKFPNDIEHKWSKGGVLTDICDGEFAERAFDLLLDRFQTATGEDASRLILEKQAPRGPEIFVSFLRDPTFGDVLLVGPGGTAVDLNPGSVRAIMPQLSPQQRRDRIADIALGVVPASAQDPYRVSTEAFANHMSRCYQEFVSDDTLQMVEFNPTILSPAGELSFVDAVVTLTERPDTTK